MRATATFGIGKNIITATLIIAIAGMTTAFAGVKSNVDSDQALKDALRVAGKKGSWSVMRGTGNSMDPHYGDHSLLLVDKVDFSKLSKGMIAIYRDADNQLVGHRVLKVDGNVAWSRGETNWKQDPEPITASNFVGIIFGILHSNGQANDILAQNKIQSLPLVHGKKY